MGDGRGSLREERTLPTCQSSTVSNRSYGLDESGDTVERLLIFSYGKGFSLFDRNDLTNKKLLLLVVLL